MKTRYWLAAAAVAVGIAGTVYAVTISNLSGQSCGTLTGTWHFVNNQTGGASPGNLTATFTSGTCNVPASSVNQNTQHFFCTGFSGTLLSASTDLPGRLVLSDFACNGTPPPPPPCNPKYEVCPK